MASKKSWPQRLADRFEAVGWEVKLGAGGHFKARRPDGRSMSWPQSPSGTRSKENNEAEARRLGLDAAEKELQERREAERLARIELDRLANGVPADRMESTTLTPEPDPKEKSENVTKYGTVEVDGVKIGIAEIAKPVMHQHPRGGEAHPLAHCRELLLVDDSIRYQCLKLLNDDQVCARHFKTSGGLVVHWARTLHANEGRDLGGVLPVEPRPEPEVDLSQLEILTDREPIAVRTQPVDDLVVPTGLVAQAVLQAGRLRVLEGQLDDLAQQAGSIASELEAVIEKLPEELASDELREKAAKFDRMMGALGQ